MAKNTEREEAGIFCLETAVWNEKSWKEELEDPDSLGQDSYDHFLRFLETSSQVRIPYRHFDVATKGELKFYLDKWKGSNIQKHFPLLLLAFHGDQKGLGVVKNETTLFTDEIVTELYDGTYDDAIIHFSSCYFLDDPKTKDLLWSSGALSVSGYTNEAGVAWYPAVAFELLYLTALFDFGGGLPPKTPSEMRKFVNKNFVANEHNKEMIALAELLGFHMWYRVGRADFDTSGNPDHIITPCPIKELEAEHEHS